MSIMTNPDGPDPVYHAVDQFALEIHNALLADMDQANLEPIGGLEQRLDDQKKNYPPLLFGELAMYLAGIQLPPDAPAPDRARGIVEALHRIATTPALFESITSAPYSSELAGGVIPKVARTIDRESTVGKQATALQETIAAVGYLEHSMLPKDCIIQLDYIAAPNLKRFGMKKVDPNSIITVKLKPDERKHIWKVNQYKQRDQSGYYRDFKGVRTTSINDIFTLISVDAQNAKRNDKTQVPPKLSKLIGGDVEIGQVTIGTQLKLDHAFGCYKQEVLGYERDVTHDSLILPASLSQAYFGHTRDYPLFSTH